MGTIINGWVTGKLKFYHRHYACLSMARFSHGGQIRFQKPATANSQTLAVRQGAKGTEDRANKHLGMNEKSEE